MTRPTRDEIAAALRAAVPRVSGFYSEMTTRDAETAADAVLALPGWAHTDAADVEAACEVMHDAYEAAASAAAWVTQEASRAPWADVPEPNKTTMRAAVTALINWLHRAPEAAPAEAAEALAQRFEYLAVISTGHRTVWEKAAQEVRAALAAPPAPSSTEAAQTGIGLALGRLLSAAHATYTNEGVERYLTGLADRAEALAGGPPSAASPSFPESDHTEAAEGAGDPTLALAERLTDAIVRISAALDGPAPVMRVRLIIASLAPAASSDPTAGEQR